MPGLTPDALGAGTQRGFCASYLAGVAQPSLARSPAVYPDSSSSPSGAFASLRAAGVAGRGAAGFADGFTQASVTVCSGRGVSVASLLNGSTRYVRAARNAAAASADVGVGRIAEREGHDRDSVALKVAEMEKSWNYHALVEGLAYPTFYSKLYVDLRQAMAAASRAAREAKKNVWSKDVTHKGFDLEKLGDVFDKAYIVPKLWRRLTSYIEFNGGDTGLEGFKDWLAQEDDRVIILPSGHVTGFDFVVDVKGQVVKLTEQLENLVFQEK